MWDKTWRNSKEKEGRNDRERQIGKIKEDGGGRRNKSGERQTKDEGEAYWEREEGNDRNDKVRLKINSHL